MGRRGAAAWCEQGWGAELQRQPRRQKGLALRCSRGGALVAQPACAASAPARRCWHPASHYATLSEPPPLCPPPPHSNVHVLRELLERAEARARQAEELLPDAADLQGQLEAAEQQLQRWRVIVEGTADCAGPEDVLHLLNSLQQRQMEAAVQVPREASWGALGSCWKR